MTNQEAQMHAMELNKLLKSETRFPSHIAYKIIRNYRAVHDIEVDYENVRDSIIREYYKPIPDQLGMFAPISNEAREKGELELDQLNNAENDITIQKFSFSEIEGLSLTLKDMDALYFMIEED